MLQAKLAANKNEMSGSLYRVDHNIPIHEMLDLDKRLGKQSPYVQKALEKVRQQLEDAGVLDDYMERKNVYWGELTGDELVKQILTRAHEDEALPAHPDEYKR